MAVFDNHKNFSFSTVTLAPAPPLSGTTLTVAPGEGADFPIPPFNATVWPANTQPTKEYAEIVRVTAIVGDQFTLLRTQEFSLTRAILPGDRIAATVTAKMITDIEQAIGTGGGGGAPAGDGYVHVTGGVYDPAVASIPQADVTNLVTDLAAMQSAIDAVVAGGAPPGTGYVHVTGGIYDPATQNIPLADVTGLAAALALTAPLASPALTGTPTAPTAAPSTTTNQLATTAFVSAAVALVPAGPAGPQGPTGPAGGILNDSWVWVSPAVLAALAAGKVGLNHDTPAQATEVWIHKLAGSTTGIDWTVVIASLTAGDKLYLQKQTDGTIYHRYTVTGVPTLNSGTTWVIPVGWTAGNGEAASGSDVVVAFQRLEALPKLDDLTAPDDNTDLNVSTAAHGLAPKLPNDATKFLNGVGAYTVPAGGGGAPAGTGYVHVTSGAFDTPAATIPVADVAGAERTANKNAANGYAGLSAASKLSGAQQTYGATANTAAEGNDARLSDARTPLGHHATHELGGSDAIKLDALAAPTDVTTLNVSIAAHGLAPKLPNDASLFLNGVGAYVGPNTVAPVSLTTTLTGLQHNLALPAGCAVLRCNNASLLTITGLSAGVDGQELAVLSVGAGQVELMPQAAGTASTAANRLKNIATIGNTPLAAGLGSARYKYDATLSRWRLLSHEQGAMITPPFQASDFIGGGTMLWAVDPSDVIFAGFVLSGCMLTVSLTVNGASLVAPASTNIVYRIPGGFSHNAASLWGYATTNDAAAFGQSLARVGVTSTGPTAIGIYNHVVGSVNFTPIANALNVIFTISFPVL